VFGASVTNSDGQPAGTAFRCSPHSTHLNNSASPRSRWPGPGTTAFVAVWQSEGADGEGPGRGGRAGSKSTGAAGSERSIHGQTHLHEKTIRATLPSRCRTTAASSRGECRSYGQDGNVYRPFQSTAVRTHGGTVRATNGR
jgi:hypothetical protein